MNQLKWYFTSTDKGDSMVLVGASDNTDPFVRSIAGGHARFTSIRDYLNECRDNGTEPDADKVLKMVDSGENLVSGMLRLSERVVIRQGQLFFDGDLIDNALSRHILRMIEQDDDNYAAFVSFMENVATNPSKSARLALFRWLNERQFTITDHGTFLAYKGVQNVTENLSITKGVESVWVDGKEHVGHIPNPIGATIEMARTEVNANGNEGCSMGLHAGTHSYAVNFGQKLLLVEINPRDVVSVPKDCSFQKLRVCRYVVLDNGEGQIEDTTYQGAHHWE